MIQQRLVSVLVFCGLVSCLGTGSVVHLISPFDPMEATRQMEAGDNKIEGSALIRQQGGGVVSCAGREVFLIPGTEYATERMDRIYGSHVRGYRKVSFWDIGIPFDPDYPEYHSIQRKETCDAQGAFEFDSIRDGSYYVLTTITWDVGGSTQGGSLMMGVEISGGTTKKIVLAP